MTQLKNWFQCFSVLIFLAASFGGIYPKTAKSVPPPTVNRRNAIRTPIRVMPLREQLPLQLPPLGDPSRYIPQELPPLPTPIPKNPLVFSPPTQFQGQIVSQGELKNQEKVIALTFDDGPWPDTLKFLEVLRHYQIKGTFFLLGKHLQLYPEIARQVVKEGHAVGNHSWSHSYQPLSPVAAKAEIENTSALIKKETGAYTRLFRPPGGILNNGIVAYAQAKKYVIVMWSIDTKDYQLPPVSTLANRVLNQAHSGAIVLMHDGGGNRSRTLEALPTIIEGLKQQGYRFVTVPELLKMEASPSQNRS